MSEFTKEELLALLDTAQEAMCEHLRNDDRDAAARLLRAWSEIRGLVEGAR
jgi:hypothetical protein